MFWKKFFTDNEDCLYSSTVRAGMDVISHSEEKPFSILYQSIPGPPCGITFTSNVCNVSPNDFLWFQKR